MQKKKKGGKAKSGGGGGVGKAGGGALKVPFGLVAPSNSKPTEGPPELYQDCTALNQQKLILRHIFDGTLPLLIARTQHTHLSSTRFTLISMTN